MDLGRERRLARTRAAAAGLATGHGTGREAASCNGGTPLPATQVRDLRTLTPGDPQTARAQASPERASARGSSNRRAGADARSPVGRSGEVRETGALPAARTTIPPRLAWSECAAGLRGAAAGRRGRLLTTGFDPSSPLLFASAVAAGGGITGKIAEKMAIDHAIEEAIAISSEPPGGTVDQRAQEIVRSCFRRANRAVYDYAHQMGAGGSMGSSLVIAAIEARIGAEPLFSVGRVGPFEGYLFRDGRCLPLFGERWGAGEGTLTRFVGANAKILVDIASLELREGDLLVLRDEREGAAPIPHTILGAGGALPIPYDYEPRQILEILDQLGVGQTPAETFVLHVPRAAIVLR